MNNKIFLFSILFFLGYSPLTTAQYWSNTYGIENNYDDPFDMLETSNGDFAILSTSVQDTSTAFDPAIFMIDKEGELLWNQYLHGNDLEIIFSFVQNEDEGFSLVGTACDGDLLCLGAVMIKTDALGNELFRKSYFTEYFTNINKILKTPDNGYLIAGTGVNGNSYDFLLLKTDAQGNEEWTKMYGIETGNVATTIGVTAMENGGYALVSGVSNPNSSFADLVLIQVDANGNELLKKIVGENFTNTNGEFWSIFEIDNGFIIISNYWTDQSLHQIFKVDLLGNVIWSEGLLGEMDFVKSGIVNNNGDILVTGFNRVGQTDEEVALVKLDSNGSLIWNKSYNLTNNRERGRIIKETSEGNLLIAGIGMPSGNLPGVPDQILVIHLGPEGELFSTNTTTLPESLTPVKIIPNPVFDFAHISIKGESFTKAHFQLFDSMGRIVLNKQISSNQTTINCLEFSNGMYYYNINIEGRIESGKFLIQH